MRNSIFILLSRNEDQNRASVWEEIQVFVCTNEQRQFAVFPRTVSIQGYPVASWTFMRLPVAEIWLGKLRERVRVREGRGGWGGGGGGVRLVILGSQ